MSLRTDYTDDILDLDQNTNRKYTITNNQDNSVSFTDVTAYEQVGSTFGAADFNATNTKVNELENSFSQALTDLKATAIAQAVGAVGNTFASVIATLATIVNRGAVSKTLGLGESYSIPQGYHNGQGRVSVSITSQEKTITASRSQQIITPDSGKVLSKVTVNKYPDASGTYNATSRGSALDMGAGNNIRYVNTNGVPNTNNGTYNVTSNGTKDMGATNSNRYVYVNVPSGVTKILTGYGQTVSLGGSYDTKCVFIMRGGLCAIYNDSVVFNNNVNYEIVVFDSTIVNKKVHGMVSLGKSSSTDVSLDGTYNTQKILVSVSFDEGQTQRGFAVYGDHVNIQNHNGGYPQDVPYDIIIFN